MNFEIVAASILKLLRRKCFHDQFTVLLVNCRGQKSSLGTYSGKFRTFGGGGGITEAGGNSEQTILLVFYFGLSETSYG